MDFDFTAEQKQFAESVGRLAREHLAEGALKRAHDPRFPFDVAQLMAEHGLMGITLPESDGGQGGSLIDAVVAIEAGGKRFARAVPTWCNSVISVRSVPSPNTARRGKKRAGSANCSPAAW